MIRNQRNQVELKGTHFIQLCDKNRTPLLFLQNITGFMVGKEYERSGISKEGAKLIMAVSGASVPKFTINCNGAFGAGVYGMSGRAFDPRFLFSWPGAQTSVMGAEQAASVVSDINIKPQQREGQVLSPQEIAEIPDPLLQAYHRRPTAYHATCDM